MSTPIEELQEQVSSIRVPVDQFPDLIELMWRKYEDETDARDAAEASREIRSGKATAVPWEDVLAEFGLKPGFTRSQS